MGNRLNEDLTGRVVIIEAMHLRSSGFGIGIDLAKRPELCAFRVRGGFGAHPKTSGNAIFGEFLFDGEKCRMEGFMVYRFATDKEIAAAEAIKEGAKS